GSARGDARKGVPYRDRLLTPRSHEFGVGSARGTGRGVRPPTPDPPKKGVGPPPAAPNQRGWKGGTTPPPPPPRAPPPPRPPRPPGPVPGPRAPPPAPRPGRPGWPATTGREHARWPHRPSARGNGWHSPTLRNPLNGGGRCPPRSRVGRGRGRATFAVGMGDGA